MTGDSDTVLIQNAQLVRDYLVAAGSPHAEALIDALDAAERSAPDYDPEVLAALRKISASVFSELDPFTLDSILSGQLKIGSDDYVSRRRRLFRVSNVATVVGFVLMFWSLHLSNWAIQADTVIRQFDYILESNKSLDLQEVANMIEVCESNPPSVDEADFARYLALHKDVRYLESIWSAAVADMGRLMYSTLPFEFKTRQAWKWVKSNTVNRGTRKWASGAQLEPPDPKDRSGSKPEFCERLLTETVPANVRYEAYETALESFASFGGRYLISGPGKAVAEISKQQLLRKKNVVSRWWLPVLHGALGGVIFCLVRSLRRFTVQVSWKEFLLRLFFGGFVGFAVSTLLIPSGLMAIEYTRPTPVASLMAFVFGYSIDSFLAVLNRLNEYFTRSLSPATAAPPTDQNPRT